MANRRSSSTRAVVFVFPASPAGRRLGLVVPALSGEAAGAVYLLVLRALDDAFTKNLDFVLQLPLRGKRKYIQPDTLHERKRLK